jgi:RNA polymerase sigma factor (sigma-70 family)
MVEFEENDLVQRAKNGDLAALNELLVKNLSRAQKTISRMLQGNDDVEDVLQKVSFNVFRSISKFDAKCQFSTWVFRIAVNECLSYHRSRNPNHFLSLDDSEVPQNTDGGSRNSIEELVLSGPSPDVGCRHRADEHEETYREIVREASARVRQEMGPEKFEILELYSIDELTGPDIAIMYSFSSADVVYDIAKEYKRRMKRALEDAHGIRKKLPSGLSPPS